MSVHQNEFIESYSAWPPHCGSQLYFMIIRAIISYNDVEATLKMKQCASLQLTGEARVGQPLTAELCLLNPLPEALQDCSFTLEGVGLTQEKPITIKYDSSRP